MDDTDKQINEIIQEEDVNTFNNRTYTGATRRLMLKAIHMLAREDMVYDVCGKGTVSDEFFKVIKEYRESVRSDMKPLIDDVNKTGFGLKRQ